MDLCIKTIASFAKFLIVQQVSILVLMDLCIKTFSLLQALLLDHLVSILVLMDLCIKTPKVSPSYPANRSFNPCFNGSMYKNQLFGSVEKGSDWSFNPCFNGSMYKNFIFLRTPIGLLMVSILVLMDLCIKTVEPISEHFLPFYVSILVLMDLCIKTVAGEFSYVNNYQFQSLF